MKYIPLSAPPPQKQPITSQRHRSAAVDPRIPTIDQGNSTGQPILPADNMSRKVSSETKPCSTRTTQAPIPFPHSSRKK